MLEQLELLLELSVLDGDLSELLFEYESLPRQVTELEERKEAVRAGVERLEAELERASAERRHLERDLEDLTARLKDLESKRLQIKTNEEYAALSLEIEHARAGISDAEDGILRSLESAEEGAEDLDAARHGAESEERVLDERIASLKSELERLADAVAVKRDERLRLSNRVGETVLRRYERILASKGDTAVCKISNGACAGCRMTLPPQTVIEIRRSDRLIECQSCGRILCWSPEGDVG